MAPVIDQILRLMSFPQGNIIYSLVLGLAAFGALVASVYARGSQPSSQSKRMQLGFTLLLLIQLTLLGSGWLSWMGVVDSHSYLPVIDRSLAMFSLVLIIWLWAFPQSNSIADAMVIILVVAIVFLGGVGVALWIGESANTTFNSSMLGGYTYYSGIGLLLIGMILLIGRRPRYWGYGLLMLLVIFAGYVVQYLIRQPVSDYGWFIHLGEMFAYILLLVLPIRLIDLRIKGETTKMVKPIAPTSLNLNTKVIQSIAELITESSPQNFYQKLTRLVTQMMHADFCLLLIPPATGEQIIIPVGYNQNQDQMLDGFTADGHGMPQILEAVKSGKNLLLTGSELENEVKTLSEELALEQVAQLLIIPFYPKGTNALMGLAVLSKVIAPVWSDEDIQHLDEIAKSLISSIGQYSKGPGLGKEQQEMMEKLRNTQVYADHIRLEYAQLKAKYDSLASSEEDAATQAESLKTLEENQKNLENNITRLESRNRELENLIARGRPSMEEVEQLRQELRSALADLARVPSTLSKSDQKMLETQLSAVKRLDKMQPTELVTSIAQEFRQPLSSLIGYTDLLLGESVGLLGAVQRKFLERVKASAERLGMLMKELIQVVNIDGGTVDQTLRGVDLKPVVDEAIGNIQAQLTEKNITVTVELPEEIPAIRANQDALMQIVGNLLENACLVTPEDGEIRLLGSVEQEESDNRYMLISVMDQGGGIANEDLPRVFLRRYKMENPIIQGIGDTGVGLSIVKSLVELLKGRVWVDTEPGIGSTFSILLPLAEEIPEQDLSTDSPD